VKGRGVVAPARFSGRRVIAFPPRWLGVFVLLIANTACDVAHGHHELKGSDALRDAPAISTDRGESRPAMSQPLRTAIEVGADGTTPAAPIRLAVGQELRIHLRASPASGYAWSLEGAPPTFLRMETDPGFEAMWSATSRVGAGTMNTWSFRIHGRGRGLLRFTYRRPWDLSSAPARVATFDVAVD
jgi:predicted secreted protein